MNFKPSFSLSVLCTLRPCSVQAFAVNSFLSILKKFSLPSVLAVCSVVMFLSSPSYSQFGTVLEQGTNTPLQNAIVSLKSTGAMVLTDAEGRFDFATAPVIYNKSGYISHNPIYFSDGILGINSDKSNIHFTVEVYRPDGSRVTKLSSKSRKINLSTHFKNSSLYFVRVHFESSIYLLKIISTSDRFLSRTVTSVQGNPYAATKSQFAHTLATDTLVASKYLYTPVYQPVAGNNVIHLTKPSSPPPPPGMKSITGGTFMMGSNGPYHQQNEIPVHQVTVSSFYMDSTEVIQADYKLLMGVEPWLEYNPVTPGVRYPGAGNRLPAWYLTWNDAVLYCNARSKRDGLDTVYSYRSLSGVYGSNSELDSVDIDYSKKGYRLPTEAEWEYAARGGTTTEFYWGDIYQDSVALRYAWYGLNARTNEVLPVSSKLPNDFGLYDMLGNVSEVTNDFFYYYSGENAVDPTGPTSGDQRCMRGGGWRSIIHDVRCTRRIGCSFYNYRDQAMTIGLRVVLAQH